MAVFLEFIIVSTSMALGVTDANMLTWSVGGFVIGISPLFHILPIVVVLVMFASWTYLTRHETYIPPRTQAQRTGRPAMPPRRYEKRSFRRLRRFANRINKALDNFGRGVQNRISNSKPGKYVEQHLTGRAVVKSAWTIVLTFCILALLAFLVVYPELIPNAVNWLLGGGNSALQGFIAWSISGANTIGSTLAPLGWIAAVIENGLAAISLGFRHGIIALTTPIVRPAVQSDLVGKYVLIQNVAAWFPALLSLYFGTRIHRRR